MPRKQTERPPSTLPFSSWDVTIILESVVPRPPRTVRTVAEARATRRTPSAAPELLTRVQVPDIQAPTPAAAAVFAFDELMAQPAQTETTTYRVQVTRRPDKTEM